MVRWPRARKHDDDDPVTDEREPEAATASEPNADTPAPAEAGVVTPPSEPPAAEPPRKWHRA